MPLSLRLTCERIDANVKTEKNCHQFYNLYFFSLLAQSLLIVESRIEESAVCDLKIWALSSEFLVIHTIESVLLSFSNEMSVLRNKREAQQSEKGN